MAHELAHAYVTLDRFVYYQLQKSSDFQNRCARVKQCLKDNEGLRDFETLCEAGAEAEELLWLLAGCEGLPGLGHTLDVFGWSAPQLSRGIKAIEKAARVIEKMQLSPFGHLARYAGAGASRLDEDLRSYLALARTARKDFGHHSQWFLNVAKARLVIHVRHHTGEPHDKEISGLIAAMTGTDYNADAQRRWRNQHDDVVNDAGFDPYTIMGKAGREQVRQSWEYLAAQEPEWFKGFARFTEDHSALARIRNTKLPNRRSAKKSISGSGADRN